MGLALKRLKKSLKKSTFCRVEKVVITLSYDILLNSTYAGCTFEISGMISILYGRDIFCDIIFFGFLRSEAVLSKVARSWLFGSQIAEKNV